MALFPVSESTLSANHLAVFLGGAYGFGPDTICSLFRKGMNHVYQVSTANTRYILRVYSHQWRSLPEIEEELRWMKQLAPLGVVPAVIPDRDGNDIQVFAAPEGDRYGVVFSYAPGQKVAQFSENASRSAGQALGRIHQQAVGQTVQRITYSVQTLLVDAMAGIKAFHTNYSPERAFLEELSEWLASQYHQVAPGAVRSGVVHLDMWFDNMHITDDDQVTVFDFDFCGNGWLIHDVSYFLYQLLYTHPDDGAYRTKSSAFLEGYESVVSLHEAERELMPIACLSVMIFYFHQQCRTFDTFSNLFMNHDHLIRYTRAMKRWMRVQGVEMNPG